MIPKFPCVLDLNAILAHAKTQSPAFKKGVRERVGKLLEGKNNGIADPKVVSDLIKMYGPKGKLPFVMKEIVSPKPDNYPHLEVNGAGQGSAYFFFEGKDGKQVSFEASIDPNNGKMTLKHALATPGANFIAVFYHSCCATQGPDGKVKIPYSTLTAMNGRMAVKSSQQALERHGDKMMMLRRNGTYEVACDIARPEGIERLKARRDHILAIPHDCSSHTHLSAAPVNKKVQKGKPASGVSGFLHRIMK